MSAEGPSPDARLSDLGEFTILEELLFPMAQRFGAARGLGDDCGFVEIGKQLLAVSVDAGPRPLIQQLPGHEEDHEAAGWHAVVATASDIATAGATPLFLLNTIDAPASLQVREFQAFLSGYFNASKHFGFSTAGGDLREGAALTVRVFGVGLVEHGERIGRGGVQPGDELVLLGAAGDFIASFLRARSSEGFATTTDAATFKRLRYPETQLQPMQLLANRQLIVAASDSSDGVLGAIANLAERSDCTFMLKLEDELLSARVRTEARRGGYDPWNLFFFWGDWSVVAAVRRERFDAFQRVAAAHSLEWRHLGSAIHRGPGIVASLGGSVRSVNVLRNESFSSVGFNRGIADHVAHMLNAPLFGATIGTV